MTLSRSQMLFATVVALAVLWLLPMVASKSHLYTATQVVVFGLFAISFNLMFGYLGLLSFGHAAYFGTGAYAAALLLSAYPSLSIPSAVFAGAVAGALVGLLVGAFCVRLKGTYFAMLTLAFGQLVFGVAWKWRSVTRGDDGFGAFIDRDIAFLGLSFSSTDIVVIYFFVTTVALVVAAAVWLLLSTTPFGSVVAAIKQNDQRAAFLGYNVYLTKLVMYVLATFMAGLAGALSAIFQDFVSTSSIDLARSTDVVIMATVGGTSSYFGPVLGAMLLVMGGDFLSTFTDHWQLIMGAIFVFVVLFAPRGLAGWLGNSFEFLHATTHAVIGWRRR